MSFGMPKIAAAIFAVAVGSSLAAPARAVPSYARQMNTQCNTCHTRFPQLNAFGRSFKLSGYTMTADAGIAGSDDGSKETLNLAKIPPLSVMFQAGWTRLNKNAPEVQNESVQFPQEFSIFLAGRLTQKIGTFLQYTYSQADGSSSLDNTEFRFADATTFLDKPLNYGVTLNNAPTIEDLWNSTPVWGFPFVATEAGVSSAASTLIDGGLSGDVAGLGGYTLWNDHLYVAATLYRSAHRSESAPSAGSTSTIDGVAPYWRVAWQQAWGSNYLEVGTYGIHAKLHPDGISGPTDDYTDIAGDFQYERPIGKAQLTVHGTWINEDRKLNASFIDGLEGPAKRKGTLDTYRLDGQYTIGAWQYGLGYFATDGSSDTGIYAPGPVEGSASGKPDTRGILGQVAYFPWQNTEFTLQYTAYNKFNGGGSNYDGDGRSASDNNTLYVNTWLMW